MGTRKVAAPTTEPVTILPNCNLSLRATYVWVDQATGHTITVDAAVIGWALSAADRPMPLTPGGPPPEAQLLVVHDSQAKHWSDSDGHVYKEWREVDAALYREWAAANPEHINAQGAQPREPQPEGITTPSVGGIGQPKPWK